MPEEGWVNDPFIVGVGVGVLIALAFVVAMVFGAAWVARVVYR